MHLTLNPKDQVLAKYGNSAPLLKMRHIRHHFAAPIGAPRRPRESLI